MGGVDLAATTADWSRPPVSTTGTTTACSVGAFSGLLDLPPRWHGFGFLDHPRRDELGDDGHPAAGRSSRRSGTAAAWSPSAGSTTATITLDTEEHGR